VYFSFISTRNIGTFIINSKKIGNDFKENIAMTFFKNEANDSIMKKFWHRT
jgi:cell division transport system permease protein